jgi:hypothetical protein
MDMITDLPQVEQYDGKPLDAILVVVDHGLTKGVIIIACSKTLTAEGAAELLLDNLYRRFGLPDSMISDRDPRFAAKSFQELLKLLGVKSKMSTVYRPQTDGTTERFNQEIEAYISIYCSSHPKEWHKKLGTMEFTHNNRRHADRTRTSFELIFGTSPIALPTSFENTRFPAVEERIKNLERDRDEALAAHELARTRMAARRQNKFTPFKLGQQVTGSYHLHDAFTVATVGCLVQLPEMNETLFVSFRILFHFCFIPTSFSFCFIYCFIPIILFHSFRATISFLYQSPCYGK